MSNLMQDVYNLITKLTYPPHYNEDSKLKLRELSKSFMLMDGLFMYHFEDTSTLTKNNTPIVRFREVVLDKKTRLKKIRSIHVSGANSGKHKNILEVQQKVLEKYHWDGIDDDIKQVVESCKTCLNGKTIIKRQRLKKRTHPNKLNLVNSLTENNGSETESSSESSDSVDDHVLVWDKVEVEILGPYQSASESGHGYYVAVFVDVFSTWTEAFVMTNSEIASLVTAIFTVICRRGVMKQILFRGSESDSSQLETVLKLFSREDCDCPVQVQHKASSSLDTHWKNLKTRLGDFVRASPHDWFQYIEFFLLPYRASRAEHKEYTASYLFSSREMRLPASISHQKSEHRELHLTETQIQESIKTVQDLFYKTLTECEDVEALLMDTMKKMASRKRKNERPNTKGPPPPKKLKSDNVKERVGSYMYDYTNYSVVVLGYLQGKGFPPNFSSTSRASVIRDAEKYELKEGKLYYRSKKTQINSKEVLVDEEDRFKVMVKAHFTTHGHLPHNNSTNTCTIISCKYYWHGMNSDIKAFLKACPRCRETDPNLSEEEDASITQSQGGIKSCRVKLVDSTHEFKQIVAFLLKKIRYKKDQAPKQLDMFCLEEDGSLYCVNSDERKRRKVIMTPEEKKVCLEEAHVTITGKHRSKEFTHSNMVKHYYWPRMCSEIDKYVQMCSVCRNNRCIQKIKSQQEAMPNYMEEVTISDIYMDTADDIQWALPRDIEWTTPIESQETMPINILQDTPSDNQEDTPSDNQKNMPSNNQESTSRDNQEIMPSDNQESIHGENKEANLSGNQESTSSDNQKVTLRDTQEAQPNTPISKQILGLKETEGKGANKKEIHISYTERLKNEDRIEKYKAMFAQKRDSLDLMIYDHEYSPLKTTPVQLFLNASADNKGEPSLPLTEPSLPLTEPSLPLTEYNCIYCKSIFTESKDLKQHMDYHKGDGRYLCEFCGLAILAKNKITSHRFECMISLDSLKKVGKVQMSSIPAPLSKPLGSQTTHENSLKKVGKIQMSSILKSPLRHSKKTSNRKQAISQYFLTHAKKSPTKIPAIQPMFNETKITQPHSTAKNTLTANQYFVKNVANQMSKKTKPPITQPSFSTQNLETPEVSVQLLVQNTAGQMFQKPKLLITHPRSSTQKITQVPGQLLVKNTTGQMSQLQVVYKDLTEQITQKQPIKKTTDAPKMRLLLDTHSDPSSTLVKVKTCTPATQQNPLSIGKESILGVKTIAPATQQNTLPIVKESPEEVKRITPATQQNPLSMGKESILGVKTIAPATQQNPLPIVKESPEEVKRITPATQQNPLSMGKESSVEVISITPATQQNPLPIVEQSPVEVKRITSATQQNPLSMGKESSVEVISITPATQQNPLSMGKKSLVEVKRNTPATQQNTLSMGKESSVEVISITQATQQNPLSMGKESTLEVQTIMPATQQNPLPIVKESPEKVKRITPATQQNPLSMGKESSVEVISITPATQQNPLSMGKESLVEVKTNMPSTQQNPLPMVQPSSTQNIDTYEVLEQNTALRKAEKQTPQIVHPSSSLQNLLLVQNTAGQMFVETPKLQTAIPQITHPSSMQNLLLVQNTAGQMFVETPQLQTAIPQITLLVQNTAGQMFVETPKLQTAIPQIAHPSSSMQNLLLVQNTAGQMFVETSKLKTVIPQIAHPSSSIQNLEMTPGPVHLSVKNKAGHMLSQLHVKMPIPQPVKKRADNPKIQSTLQKHSDPSLTVVKVKPITPATSQNPLSMVEAEIVNKTDNTKVGSVKKVKIEVPQHMLDPGKKESHIKSEQDKRIQLIQMAHNLVKSKLGPGDLVEYHIVSREGNVKITLLPE